jgi:hypothetical protein
MTQIIPLPHYYACLLRIWRENETDPWRVLIQHPNSDEPLLFPDLLAAFAYIEIRLARGRAGADRTMPTEELD